MNPDPNGPYPATLESSPATQAPRDDFLCETARCYAQLNHALRDFQVEVIRRCQNVAALHLKALRDATGQRLLRNELRAHLTSTELGVHIPLEDKGNCWVFIQWGADDQGSPSTTANIGLELANASQASVFLNALSELDPQHTSSSGALTEVRRPVDVTHFHQVEAEFESLFVLFEYALSRIRPDVETNRA